MARSAPFPSSWDGVRASSEPPPSDRHALAGRITTMRRAALLAVALATATPALADPADAANPDYRASQQLAASCPPELKYADGTCVSTCPSGYADRGRVCVFRNEDH